ncbi:hypothetical protein Acor_22370 [Acrocarpospora corrugata]|uniref:Uncharacterized protein n=1 Tax=Acrocarpospora corrugata TaxID=35763 RepID=A0A5M3VUH8_9ACTN|nr:hypothetical protein [Acrocarpospora corrugata]GES00174.1 hypothetical protein Acor_22370 [Acrocarpospora corrugata]
MAVQDQVGAGAGEPDRRDRSNAVHGHHAGLADVDHAEFPAFQEVLRAERFRAGQRQRLRAGHGPAEDEAVLVRVEQPYLARGEQILGQEPGPQPVGAQAGDLVGRGGVPDVHSGSEFHYAEHLIATWNTSEHKRKLTGCGSGSPCAR